MGHRRVLRGTVDLVAWPGGSCLDDVEQYIAQTAAGTSRLTRAGRGASFRGAAAISWICVISRSAAVASYTTLNPRLRSRRRRRL